MFILYKRINNITFNGYYKFVKYVDFSTLLLFNSYHYSTKSQYFSITKDKLIKLLNESLINNNYKRISAIILESSNNLDGILNKSLKLDRDGLNINITEQDFLQPFDILILWRSIRLAIKCNDEIKDIVDKLLKVTQMQLYGFSFIRLTLVLHQISQLFSHLEVFSLDNLNRELTIHHLSHLSDIDIDSHSLCLLFNYITNTPYHDIRQYVETCENFINFMGFHSKKLTFTQLDNLYIFKTANKLYQRYKDSQVVNIALESLNSYINNNDDLNLTQIIRFCNQLLSNFDRNDLTHNYELYKELLNNILLIINKLQVDNGTELCKKTTNLLKRLNKLSLG